MSDTRSIADGSHPFHDAYEHRSILLLAFLRTCPFVTWKSRRHASGTMGKGWFVVGAELPAGPIRYHLPERLWHLASFIEEVPCAPVWDGHTSEDVLTRLSAFITVGPAGAPAAEVRA